MTNSTTPLAAAIDRELARRETQAETTTATTTQGDTQPNQQPDGYALHHALNRHFQAETRRLNNAPPGHGGTREDTP